MPSLWLGIWGQLLYSSWLVLSIVIHCYWFWHDGHVVSHLYIYIYIKNVVTFWDFHAPLPKIVKKNEKVDSRWECTCALLKVKISKSHFPSVSSTPTVFEREIRALYPIFQSSFGKILMSAYGAFASMFRQASGHSSSPAMPSLNLKDLSCPRLVGLSGKWMWIVNGTYEHVVCQPMAICGGMSETKIFNIYILCSVT